MAFCAFKRQNFFVAKIILSVLVLIVKTEFSNGEEKEMAVDSMLLSTIRSYMDETQNPCKNFFGYACGKWKDQQNPKTHFDDSEGYLRYKFYAKLAAGFEQQFQKNQSKNEPLYKLASDYYESCRRITRLDVYKYREAFNVKYNKMESSSERNWSWLKMLNVLRSYGLRDVLLSVTVERKNNAQGIIVISKPKQMHTEGFDQWESPRGSVRGIFRQKVKNLMQKHDQSNNATIKIRDGGLKSERYYKPLLEPYARHDTEILVTHPDYVREIIELVEETHINIVASFIETEFVAYLQNQQLPRSTDPVDCMEHMYKQLPQALDYIYVEEIYRTSLSQAATIVDTLLKKLKMKFLETLSEHENEFSREQLLFLQNKLLLIQLHIGQQLDDSLRNTYYDGLEVTNIGTDAFFLNNLNTMHHRFQKEFELLEVSATSPEYRILSFVNPPSYDRNGNFMILPFILFQDPIFDKDYDELFYYSGLGNIIGHEIAHAFDIIGLKYDGNGDPSDILNNVMEGSSHFQDALQCLNKEPTNRLNEKIAEFVGSSLAYEAYFERNDRMSQESSLPFSEKQLFFLHLSQFYCAKEIPTDGGFHSPDSPSQLLNQIVNNNKDFAAAFNCPRTDVKEFCTLW